ncbi:hypothetical protein BC829DRAFT_91138 [Chytridium lagenaria]|nr:hypothetical protein BC829DRAFT_91138 [Chytridium lagenaria]
MFTSRWIHMVLRPRFYGFLMTLFSSQPPLALSPSSTVRNLPVFTMKLSARIQLYFQKNSSAFLTSSPYSHRRLPDYHPALLLNCLYYGQHETVKGILVYLLRYLDQAQECREEISEIPSLFWTLMNNTDYGSSEGQQTVNYDALFTLDDVETNGLHGFNDEKAERLSSILFQVDLPGLSKLEKQHLGAIAKTFVKVDQEKTVS